MNSRVLVLFAIVLFAATSAAPAADLCRFRGRTHSRLGNFPSTPIAHTPRKSTPSQPKVSLQRHNRGKYPYVGKRVTPKRTFAY